MPTAARHESIHTKESSVFALLSGWTQQGVQAFFATQRILIDLAMRQNANVMHTVRHQMSDSHHSPGAILSELAGDGMTTFIEGQKVLLDLGKQQNEILLNGLKERIGDCPRRIAAIDLLRRSVESFIHMQEEFLKVAGKEQHTWMEAVKAGKPYQPEHVVGLAREGMDNFVKAQKRFLDVVADEIGKATRARPAEGARKAKKTEVFEIARQATESLIEAQKRLMDVAGRQMDASVKTAGKALDLLQPLPFLPLGELTNEAVKSYVDAQRALMDVIVKPTNGHQRVSKAARAVKRPARTTAAATA